MKLNKIDTKAQSENAYKQHCRRWRRHAQMHARFAPFKPLTDFINAGVGKALIIVGNGYSLEQQFDVLKEHHKGHDILCCDKTLGHLLANGIRPTYCLVADARVNYKKYMEPWKDQLQDTTLFMTITANPKWSFRGNWKDKYFFVNFDVLRSEEEFKKLSGCQNVVPAATNVSNSMVVFVTQSDNTGRRNFFGYDKIILLGFDYSWRPGGNYYAFDHSAKGKFNYMRHVYAINREGQMVYTSTNLLFSAQWLENYISLFHLPIVNCSVGGVLSKAPVKPLASQLPYSFLPGDRDIVRADLVRRSKLKAEIDQIERRLNTIGEKHWNRFIETTL